MKETDAIDYLEEYLGGKRELERVEELHGFPPCPMCDQQLSLRPMPDSKETYWHCTLCLTQWETPDLIEALNDNLEIANKLEETDA